MRSVLDRIGDMPLIAILRGIKPAEIDAVADVLVGAGFRFVEVTLNSPDWRESLTRLAKRHAGEIVIGAGTVLRAEDVAAVRDAGGEVVISPNMNVDVIRETKARGLISAPGCYTPSECFAALDAGADLLKIFPADALGPGFVKAMRAVLPAEARICPTGGVTLDRMGAFFDAGVFAVGLGSALYKPNKSSAIVAKDAAAFVQRCRDARG